MIFISIILMLFTILSFKKQNIIENFSSNSKVAIVSMVTKQPDFDFWLE